MKCVSGQFAKGKSCHRLSQYKPIHHHLWQSHPGTSHLFCSSSLSFLPHFGCRHLSSSIYTLFLFLAVRPQPNRHPSPLRVQDSCTSTQHKYVQPSLDSHAQPELKGKEHKADTMFTVDKKGYKSSYHLPLVLYQMSTDDSQKGAKAELQRNVNSPVKALILSNFLVSKFKSAFLSFTRDYLVFHVLFFVCFFKLLNWFSLRKHKATHFWWRK